MFLITNKYKRHYSPFSRCEGTNKRGKCKIEKQEIDY